AIRGIAIHRECLRLRIEDPAAGDGRLVIAAQLAHGVRRRIRRGKDLAYPVRMNRDRPFLRHSRHALAAPSRRVGPEAESPELDVDLASNPPAAGVSAAAAPVEFWTEDADDSGLRVGLVACNR